MKNCLTSALVIAALLGPLAHQVHAETIEQSQCVSYESELFAQRNVATVTQSDVDAFIAAQVPPDQRKVFLDSPDRIAEMVETLLSTYAMANRALDADLTADPVVSARLNMNLARELASMYRDEYLSSHRLDDYESAAREIYLTDPDSFVGGDSYDLHHILIEDRGRRNSPELMRKALDTYERLAAGEDFDQVAADVVAETGQPPETTLKGIRPSELVSPIRGALSDAEEGELLAPIRSQYGWHIVRLDSVNEGEQIPWEEARSKAINLARQRHEQRLLERLRMEIQGKEAQLTEGAVAALLERYDVEWSGSGNPDQLMQQTGSN